MIVILMIWARLISSPEPRHPVTVAETYWIFRSSRTAEITTFDLPSAVSVRPIAVSEPPFLRLSLRTFASPPTRRSSIRSSRRAVPSRRIAPYDSTTPPKEARMLPALVLNDSLPFLSICSSWQVTLSTSSRSKITLSSRPMTTMESGPGTAPDRQVAGSLQKPPPRPFEYSSTATPVKQVMR